MTRPLLLGIDRLVLRIDNLSAAVHYYRETLGLEVVHEAEQFATLRLGDDREILLHNDPDLPAEAVFLLVADVRDLYGRRDALKLRFAAPPGRVSRGYKATVKDPFGTVLLLIDRSLATAGTAEDVKTAGALFPGVPAKLSPEADRLVPLYEAAGRTADDLPYTPQLEQIHAAYAAGFIEPQPTRAETWRHLLLLRKKGALPRLGAAKSRPVRTDEPTEALIRQLLGEEIGRRDRLPYSERFDAMADEVNRYRVRSSLDPLAPRQLWRIVASMAK